jgi:hypothetical protein
MSVNTSRELTATASTAGGLAGQVRDVSERQRYELDVEGHVAFIDYRKSPGVVAMTHAEVPAQLGNRGIGTALVRGAVRLARAEQRTVQPYCSFVAAVMRRHPGDAG